MSDVELKIDGLERLAKALKMDPPPAIRIGILGGADTRKDGGLTNAEIGAHHEFGTSKMPQRSFLRIPLATELPKQLEKLGAVSDAEINRVLASGNMTPWLEKVRIVAEGVVLTAFDNGGYGKWPALKPSTMARKQVKQMLVETQQLRNSITSEIVGGN